MSKAASKGAISQDEQVAILVKSKDLDGQLNRLEELDRLFRDIRTVVAEVNMNHELDSCFIRSVMALAAGAIKGVDKHSDDAISHCCNQRSLL